MMDDFWSKSAAKLKAELDALGIALTATDDEITAIAGGWFAAMSDKVKASIIATMRAA
ncbi:hypothetical protein [Janthinobacterium sp. CAN_S7]|uniref:hypothetical protein n=1 Tax=Janthinobacterium sp. CAN_S7 TaxID=3071704 RepID=UPI00319DD5B3